MRLEPLLDPELVLVVESPADKQAVLGALARAARPALPDVPEAELIEELVERERRHPTSTPEGAAFPHAMLPDIDKTVVVALLLRPGVEFGVASHPPADVVFGMFGSADKPFSHVRLLARLSRIAHAPGALDRLRKAADAAGLFEQLVSEDRSHV